MGEEPPQPANTRTEAVFLIHASQDAEAARRICGRFWPVCHSTGPSVVRHGLRFGAGDGNRTHTAGNSGARK
jgi:hypothetical protein